MKLSSRTDESVVSAAAAMYQEQVPSYRHLDQPFDEGRFVFECIPPSLYYVCVCVCVCMCVCV